MEEKAKSYLLGQLRPALGDSCVIERVRISFSNIHLLGLYIPAGDQPFSIRVEDLRIGFNPFHIIRHGFQPRAFSQDVMVKKPSILIRSQDQPAQEGLFPRSEQIRLYLRKMQQLEFLKRMSVLDGEIGLELSSRERLAIVNGLEGWLISDASGALHLRLSGHPLDARQSTMTMEGSFGLDHGGLDTLHAVIARLPLRGQWPWPAAAGIHLLGGELEADISLTAHPMQESDLHLAGWVQVRKLAAVMPERHLRIDQTGFMLRLQEDRIEVTGASGWINETPASLTGFIEDLSRPRLELQLAAPEVDLNSFREWLPEKSRSLEGRMSLEIAIGGLAAAPSIQVAAAAPVLHFKGFVLERVSLAARWHSDSLCIESLRGSWQNLDFDTEGWIVGTGDSSRLQGSFALQGELLPLLRPEWSGSLLGARVTLASRISGLLPAPEAEGDMILTLTGPAASATAAACQFVVKDRRLQIVSLAGSAGAIRGVMDWSKPDLQFSVNLLSAGAWLQPIWPDLAAAMKRRAWDLNLHLNRLAGSYGFQAQLNQAQTARTGQPLAGLSARFDQDGLKWNGVGTVTLWPDDAEPLKGHFSVHKDSTRLILRDWTMGEWFSGVLQVSAAGVLSGSCFLQDVPLESLLKRAGVAIKGTMDGEVLFAGTVRQPRLHGAMRLQNGWFHSAGPFQCEGAFSGDAVGWTIERLLLTNEGTNLLFANGWYRSGTDSLYLRVQGAGFEMSRLAPAFLPGARPLQGQTVADLELTGLARQPQLSGQFRITNGACYGLPFDELQAQLGPRPNLAAQPRNDGRPEIALQRLAIHRNGVLGLVAEGLLPLGKEEELDIDLRGNGNFLSLLTDINPYFMESASDGRLSARIGGTWAHPRIREAELTIINGVMRFETVMPIVTGLNARLTYVPEAQFLRVDYLQGRMGGRPIRIGNQLSRQDLAARPLANLVFPHWGGLNFGVIYLETGEEGVELNILGLMERGKFGTVHLAGRLPGESFYCAGPIERPVFRGLVKAADLQFMFPFDESLPEQSGSVVLDILLSAEWDVAVRVLNDVRYVKFIPGGIDKVYANLLIEEGGEDLEFTGQWNDSTFRIGGQARSTSGVVEYLDMTFRIEQGGAQWDRSSLFPLTWGQARTTVTDSLGFTSQIFLTVQTIDETMDKKEVEDIVRQEVRLGRWDKIRFKLSTDNPNLGSTEAQLLASLGYSERTLQNKAVDVIGINTENYLLRPFFRPVERTLEHLFRFDYVRFSSRFTRNFLNANLNDNLELNHRLALLRSSKLILGKYIARSVFIQYTGQIEAGVEYRYQDKGLGLRHTFGLEYRISPQVLLELEYDYDSLMLYNRDDKRIMLRHWFPF